MGIDPLWFQAAETIANVRRRLGRLSAAVMGAGELFHRDFHAQLAAMDDAVATRDTVQLTALANQLQATLDRLDDARLARMRREVTAPDHPTAGDQDQPFTPQGTT